MEIDFFHGYYGLGFYLWAHMYDDDSNSNRVTQHGGYIKAYTCRLTETMMQSWFKASFFDIGHLGYGQLKRIICMLIGLKLS